MCSNFKKISRWLPFCIDLEIRELIKNKFQNRIKYSMGLESENKIDEEIESLKLRRELIYKVLSNMLVIFLAILPLYFNYTQSIEAKRPIVFVDNATNNGFDFVNDKCSKNECSEVRGIFPVVNKGETPASISLISMLCNNESIIISNSKRILIAPNQSLSPSFKVPDTLLSKDNVTVANFTCKINIEYLGPGSTSSNRYRTEQSFNIELLKQTKIKPKFNVIVGGDDDVFE